jgi:lipoprotein NlpD
MQTRVLIFPETWVIIIRHNDRYLSAYSHNSVMMVNVGSRVNVGEKIGEVGINLSGVPMLHFEIRVDGKPADPGNFLPRR